MNSYFVRSAVALALTAACAPTAMAQSTPQGYNGQQSPSAAELAPGGYDQASSATIAQQPAPPAGGHFGQHVSGMAPQHPKDHGPLFGDCVSEMAITGECSHHH